MGGRIKRTVSSLPVSGATVLVRADLNVPPVGGRPSTASLAPAVPTIRYLLDRGHKVVVVGHLLRPDGPDPAFSLRPHAAVVANLLGRPVHFVDTAVGPRAMMAAKCAPAGSVILLENLRFYPGEEANSAAFAADLAKASGAAYFVQDDRRAARTSAASTVAITQHLPSVAGFCTMDVWSGPGVKYLLDAAT